MQIFIVLYGSNIPPSCSSSALVFLPFQLWKESEMREKTRLSQQFPFDYTWTRENCLYYAIWGGDAGGIFMSLVSRDGWRQEVGSFLGALEKALGFESSEAWSFCLNVLVIEFSISKEDSFEIFPQVLCFSCQTRPEQTIDTNNSYLTELSAWKLMPYASLATIT